MRTHNNPLKDFGEVGVETWTLWPYQDPLVHTLPGFT